MMNRRRFLCLTAAALCPAPGLSQTIAHWQGQGLGATLTLRLLGVAPHRAQRLFARITTEIDRIERLASLYRDSALTRLNRDGHLSHPGPDLLALLELAGRVHAATGGAFDPSVQPLWLATATRGDIGAARALTGWDRIRLSSDGIRLGRGQALTLNGIAQGWAADRIAALLRDAGLTDALIDMGEILATGPGPEQTGWPVTIAAPGGRPLGATSLAGRALATSSPRGTLIGDKRAGKGSPHILGPRGQHPLWQTVSVSAPSAALADALSTAFCLMPRPAIAAALARFPGARVELLDSSL